MNKLRHLIPALLALTLLASCTRTSSPPDASSSAQPWENAELFLSLATEGVSWKRPVDGFTATATPKEVWAGTPNCFGRLRTEPSP